MPRAGCNCCYIKALSGTIEFENYDVGEPRVPLVSVL
jgi:hypothetical protein